MVEPLSPFVNKEMSTLERIKYKAERDFNLECERNGGEPSLKNLQFLYNVYNKLKLDFKAAETLEQIEEMYPGKGSLNNIGLHYSNSGHNDKALSFYEKAFKKNASEVTAFNIAFQYKGNNKEEYINYLKKAHDINPEHNPSAYSLAIELRKQGNASEADSLLNKAFNNWQTKFDNNEMSSSDYSWFSSCAKALGKHDYAQHILDSEPKENLEKIYNSENLTQFKQEDGLQKL